MSICVGHPGGDGMCLLWRLFGTICTAAAYTLIRSSKVPYIGLMVIGLIHQTIRDDRFLNCTIWKVGHSKAFGDTPNAGGHLYSLRLQVKFYPPLDDLKSR